MKQHSSTPQKTKNDHSAHGKQWKGRIFQLLLIGSLGWGCERAHQDQGSTSITLKTPTVEELAQNQKIKSLSQASGQKVCMGVQVKGPGINSSAANSCLPVTGLLGGTVEAGGEISLPSVPKGTGRDIELFTVFVDPGLPCPGMTELTGSFESLSRLMLTGAARGVTLANDIEVVNIAVTPIDFSQSMVSSVSSVCLPAPELRAVLTSPGLVLNSQFDVTSSSSPLIESIYSTSLGGALAKGAHLSSGWLFNDGLSGIELPPWLRSLTRKPDLGIWLALDSEGGIYSVALTAQDGFLNLQKMGAANCPFELANCQVPPWMQSISAGFGRRLYGMDHAGQIYRLTSTEPVLLTGFNLGPTAAHFSFY